jgi:hypothetical protein
MTPEKLERLKHAQECLDYFPKDNPLSQDLNWIAAELRSAWEVSAAMRDHCEHIIAVYQRHESQDVIPRLALALCHDHAANAIRSLSQSEEPKP